MLYLSKDFSDYLCDKRNFSALPIIYSHLIGSIFASNFQSIFNSMGWNTFSYTVSRIPESEAEISTHISKQWSRLWLLEFLSNVRSLSLGWLLEKPSCILISNKGIRQKMAKFVLFEIKLQTWENSCLSLQNVFLFGLKKVIFPFLKTTMIINILKQICTLRNMKRNKWLVLMLKCNLSLSYKVSKSSNGEETKIFRNNTI